MNIAVIFLLSTTLLAVVMRCESANILCAVFTPSYSHQIAFRPLWRALSRRGHQLHLLTTDPMRDGTLTNLTEIDLSESYDVMNSHKTTDLLSSKQEGLVGRTKGYMLALSATARTQLQNEQVQQLLHKYRHHFDLLIVEAIYPTQMSLAWWFDVPFIGIVSLDAPSRLHSTLGNPVLPAAYPDANLPFHGRLSFPERVMSTVFLWMFLLYGEYILYPREDATVRHIFGDSAPSLSDIQKNMSALFINTNPVFHNVRPLGPTTVQIGGGMHLMEPGKLQKDVEEFLDKANEGFIYFSLGTNVKSSALDAKVKSALVRAFSEIPYKVLWKFEETSLDGLSYNVKIVSWLPSQTAVLAHKNIKVFIMQCGLQSIEEAIYYHVPMVGIPFYGDQGNNAKILETRGIGLRLDVNNIDKESIKSAILTVAKGKTYRQNIKDIAFLLQDQDQTGLDRAIWWTEYVLRHRGTKHLKNPAADMPFYQWYSLDVIGFLLCLISTIWFGLKLIIKIIWKCLKGLYGWISCGRDEANKKKTN